MLKIVIQRDPKRTVAYLNLADAAQKAGQKQLAALARIAYAIQLEKPLPNNGLVLGCSADGPLTAVVETENDIVNVTCPTTDGIKARKIRWANSQEIIIEE